MRHLLLISLCCLLYGCYIPPIELSVTQTPILESDLPHKSYQTIGNVCQTADGGLVTVLSRVATNFTPGSSSSQSASRSEVVSVKTDAQGQVQWTKLVWTGIYSNYAKQLLHLLPDGTGLIFLSTTHYNSQAAYPNQDLIKIHISNTGEVLDKRVVEEVKLEGSFSTQKILTLTDGFVVSGRTNNGNTQLLLLRFDNQGQLIWSHTYDQLFTDSNTYSLATTSDGGMILTWSGYNANVQSQHETNILKIATDGQQVWTKKYALFGSSPVISESNDKGYIILETSTSNNLSLVAYKFNEDAGIQWVKLYSIGKYSSPLGIFASNDAYVAAYSTSPATVEFLTTDLDGIEQSRETISGISLPTENNGILRLSDGSFVYAGQSLYSTINLIRTKPDKSLQWNATIATNN